MSARLLVVAKCLLFCYFVTWSEPARCLRFSFADLKYETWQALVLYYFLQEFTSNWTFSVKSSFSGWIDLIHDISHLWGRLGVVGKILRSLGQSRGKQLNSRNLSLVLRGSYRVLGSVSTESINKYTIVEWLKISFNIPTASAILNYTRQLESRLPCHKQIASGCTLYSS